MKLDSSVYHLCVFMACIISLTIIVVTGHDNSPLLHQLTSGLFGGVMGASATGSLPLVWRLMNGPGDPPTAAAPVTRQGGYSKAWFVFTLCILTASITTGLTACASLQQAASANPVDTSCASTSAALKTITTARQTGVLTASEISSVDRALIIITPICSAPAQPDAPAATVAAINSALVELQIIALAHPVKGA